MNIARSIQSAILHDVVESWIEMCIQITFSTAAVFTFREDVINHQVRNRNIKTNFTDF